MTSPIDLLAGLFAGEGLQRYLGEDLSIAAHMLQAGALAESAGAPSALVVAALLHDVGHFGAIAPRQTGAQQLEATDHRHQEIGADWLAKWFPQAVTEPVRLHVLAKRYLCSVESGYLETLSPASVHTLALQGGPLTASETWAFERLPYARDAVAMRRWDEVAKDPAVATPPFEHFREILAQARKR